ncbi:MAG: hypothetical protein II008_13850, partial [Oscillospiraceae bacterium]|nr:hypothetical protein [Oscillospiraceae bacterium]
QDYTRRRAEEQEAYEREQEAAAIQRALENQAYTRRTAEEQEAYNRRKYNEQVGRQLEQQEYERQKYEEEVRRKLEQQEYERRIYEEEVRRKQDQQSWERQQQAYSNLYAIIKATGYMPSEDELAAAGMSYEEANALSGEFFNQRAQEELAADLARDRAIYGSSGGGGGGRSYSSPSYSGYDYDYAYDDYDYDYAPAASSLVYAGASNAKPLSFGSQREFDAYLKGEVANGTLTQREATDLRDKYSGPGAAQYGSVIEKKKLTSSTSGKTKK